MPIPFADVPVGGRGKLGSSTLPSLSDGETEVEPGKGGPEGVGEKMGQQSGEKLGEEGMQLVIYQGLKCVQKGAREREGQGKLFPHLVRGKEKPL